MKQAVGLHPFAAQLPLEGEASAQDVDMVAATGNPSASHRKAEAWATGARIAFSPQPQDSSDTLLSRALFSARVIDHLGTGSQSSVTLVELPCLDCDSGSEPLLAARKMLMAGNSREALLREATALRAAAAASPFVCRCLGWAQLPGGRLALLTEYADGGSLQDELDALVQIRRQQALEAEAAWQQARAARASAAVEAALALRGSFLPPTPARPAAATAPPAEVQPSLGQLQPAQPQQQAPRAQPAPQALLPAGCAGNHEIGDADGPHNGIFRSINALEHRRSGSTCSCPLPAHHGAALASSAGAGGAVRCLSAPPPSPATPEPAAADASPPANKSWQLDRGEVTSARRFLAYPETFETCTSPAALAAALAAPSIPPHLQLKSCAAALPLTILRLPQSCAGGGSDANADAVIPSSLVSSCSVTTSCCTVEAGGEPGGAAEGGEGGSGGELPMQMLLCGGGSSFFSATSSSVRGGELSAGEGEEEEVMGGSGGLLGPMGMGVDMELDMELEDCADSSCLGGSGSGDGGSAGRAWAIEDGVEEMGEGEHDGQACGRNLKISRCASFSSGFSAGDSAWASAGGEFAPPPPPPPPPALVLRPAGCTGPAATQPPVVPTGGMASAAAATAPQPGHPPENQQHHQHGQPQQQAAPAVTSNKPAVPVTAAPAAAAAAPAAVLPPRMPPSEMLMAESRLRVVAASLLHALYGLHVQGFVHLHITPANVLCSGIGRVLLADFGTARCLIAAPHAHTDGLPCYHHVCPAPPPCPTGLMMAAASAGARAAAASAAACALTADHGGRGRVAAGAVLERLRSWAAAAGDAAARHHFVPRTRACAAAAGSDAGAAGTIDDGAAAPAAGLVGRGPNSSASVGAAEAALMVFTAPELRKAAVAAASSAATAVLSAGSLPHAEVAAAVHAAVAAAVHAAASPAADMYSLGVLLTACVVWHGDVGRMRAYQRYETDMPGWVPAGLRRLVEGLLDERPCRRPSAAAALCDPYLAGLSMDDLLI